MKRVFTASSVAILAVLVMTAGCRSTADTTKSETQREFGVRMAKMNLWREAMFRFRRAVEIEPDNAMAHNNLAVALEANGDFEGAAREYREALRLDRSNQYIQKNYSRFVEFTQRSKKRQQVNPAATTAASKTAAAPAPAATPAAPPVPTAEHPAPPATTTNPPGGSL